MTTERAAVLPSAALYALPPLSVLGLVGPFATDNALLVPVFGVLFILTLAAELVVLPVCLTVYIRHPQARSRAQAGALALIALHLVLCLVAAGRIVLGGADHSAESMALGRTKAQTDILCGTLELHRDTTGALPTKAEGLEVMIEPSHRSKTNPALMDGWKRPMLPVISGNSIVGVYSAGSNGKDEGGSGDDIACLAERGK